MSEWNLILMKLIREGCMRSRQQQLGTWEKSKNLFEDRRKPRKSVSR
jgi:hypothetical protein